MKMFKNCAIMVALLLSPATAYAGGLMSEIVEAATKLVIKESSEKAAETASKAAIRQGIKSAARETVENAATKAARGTVTNTLDDVARIGGQIGRSVSPVASKLKQPLAEATEKLSPQQSRRLAMMMADMEASGKAPQVLGLIAKNGKGDQVVDFLWRNKTTLVGGATIATLLSNPEASLTAGTNVATTAIKTTGENLVMPLASIYFPTVFIFFGLIAIAFAALYKSRLKTWFELSWYLFKPMRRLR